MPTITCSLADLNRLTGMNLTAQTLDERANQFKGEVKGYTAETGELKLELQDTNRPDLWCVEGIARQLRTIHNKGISHYPDVFSGVIAGGRDLIVDPRMEAIRPYAAGFAVCGLDVTDDLLIACIQTQEKLAENLGRKRKSISIGIYDLDQIVFPVHYTAVGLDEVTFIPLGFDEPMTPRQILESHPKGIEYRYTLEGKTHVPMLMDASGSILSFPPIINSRASGEVKVGRRNLFIEATGTDIENLVLALNIFAVNMADRGGRIEPVRVVIPFDTRLGREIVVPFAFDQTRNVQMKQVRSMLGVDYTVEHAVELLTTYGLDARSEGEVLRVKWPSWRHDLLHDVDVIEDIAISAGYESFMPMMPSDYTIGSLSPMTLFGDRIRDIMLSLGFEELIGNILCNRTDFAVKLREPDRPIIEIANPMSETYSAVRDRLLPSLLSVERDSSGATYPHRMFEVGEVTIRDESVSKRARTTWRLGVLIADASAEFSNAHSYLEAVFYQFGLESSLQSVDLPPFIPGRCGEILLNGNSIGWIGELHPEVLENFEIGVPCAAFEIDLIQLRQIVSVVV